jgi:hypothetical protein
MSSSNLTQVNEESWWTKFLLPEDLNRWKLVSRFNRQYTSLCNNIIVTYISEHRYILVTVLYSSKDALMYIYIYIYI